MNGFNFGGAAAPAAPAAGGGMFIPGLGIIRSPGLAPPHAPPGNNTSYDSICSACGATTFGASCCCGNDSSPAAAAAAGMLGNNGSAGSPGLQNFSSLGFGNANNNNALNTNLNNAASAASSPATPATGGGFSFDGNPSASSSFSSSPSTTTEVRISGQASPKMLMVSQKNIQIKAEAAMTDILVNRWGPHMLEMLMKEFNSMPDSQQLEQMKCSWLPGGGGGGFSFGGAVAPAAPASPGGFGGFGAQPAASGFGVQPAAGGVGGFGSLGAAAGGFGVPRAPGAFGAAPGGAAPGAFGAPAAGGYGQQQQAVGTKSVQYQPKVIPQNGGKDAGWSYLSISYMPQFNTKSHAELRMEDLRGGQQQPNTQLTLTNPTGVGGFGSPAAVGGFGAPAVGDFGAPAAGAGGFGGASASGGNMFGGGGFGGFGAQAASTSAPRCSAGHAMVVSDFAEGPYSGGYNCDLCCGSNSDNPERWFCKKCQADVCFRCKPRTVQVTPSPPSSPEEKLHDAIVENDLVSVTALLDGGANVSDFKNVLSPACQWDRVEMLQLFDARGADLLNAVNGGGVRGTLLHTCSGYGSEKCANFLLSKGIDHKKKTSKGTSSLDYCRMNGQFIPDKRGKKNKKTKAREPSPRRKEIEKLILSKMTPEEKKKDDEKKKQGSGGFSFGGAAQPAVGGFGAPAVGGFGAPAAGAGGFGGASASSSNMFGGGGWGAPSPPSPPSPEEKIYDAIVENDLVSVTALLDGGANVNDFDHVLRPACEWDRVEMLQLFDARGADLLNAVGGFGGRNTLLHICSMYGAVKCANFLLSKGIDHKKKSSDGFGDKSSLDYCRINGQLKPAKRGVSGGNTQASEPSPERKEIEKLILSKMSPEEKKEDDSGGFSFGGAAQPAAGGFGAPAVGGFGAPAAGAGGFGGAPASSSNMFGGGFGGGFGAPAKPPSPPSPEEKIYDAIVENDLVSVTALLDGGANVSDWKNVLQPACEWDRVEMLQLFDARGADLLNAVGRLKKKFNDFGSSGVGGSTLLHICSLYGAVKCANFLLSKGIDHKKRKGGFGNTSLDCCRKNGQNIPAKRGVMSGITEASEPSPERKEIEKLILSKMKSEKELFELAANQGDADAQYDLGCLYANGQGVEQSNEKAREWMIKAAEQGHEKAIKGLQAIDKYEGKTTPSQKT